MAEALTGCGHRPPTHVRRCALDQKGCLCCESCAQLCASKALPRCGHHPPGYPCAPLCSGSALADTRKVARLPRPKPEDVKVARSVVITLKLWLQAEQIAAQDSTRSAKDVLADAVALGLAQIAQGLTS